MGRIGGSSAIVTAVILIALGIILRWDLVDWIIDVAGLLLIIVGVIIGIIGLVDLFSGKGRRYNRRY